MHGPLTYGAAVQVLELKPLQEQLDVLVAKGRTREALAVCEALDGEAQDPGIKDRLRVALGVHLCDEVRVACSPPPSIAFALPTVPLQSKPPAPHWRHVHTQAPSLAHDWHRCCCGLIGPKP